jgi:hypothetical protein
MRWRTNTLRSTHSGGERDTAPKWLDTTMPLWDRGFRRLKSDPLMDLLRMEPRLQAIERELRFPNGPPPDAPAKGTRQIPVIQASAVARLTGCC